MSIKLYPLLLLLLINLQLGAQNEQFLFSPQGIAEIHISLANGKSISDIKNEKVHADYIGKVKATMIVINSATSKYNEQDLFSGNILIDGRGNTSWHHDKRPYNIDLVGDDWESEVSTALLGMPPGEEWCLIAFWEDRSLMRFQIASYMGQFMTGMSWVPRNRYVEIWINNDYRGLYALTEKIERHKNRIDIEKLNETSTDITGGYLLEGSSPEKLKPIDKEVQFRTAQDDINFTFKYPKPQDITSQQQDWIKNYLGEFETVLRQTNFNDPINGYQKYINVESFIDWTILYELSKGVDNLFHASIFVHKDRGGKLNMSSPWDFDLSYGNSGIFTIEGTWVRNHRWFGRLYKDPAYAQKFNDRFIELLPLFNSIPDVISANYEQLEKSGALEREYEKFSSIINSYYNKDGARLTPTSYKGHARYLSEWFMSRKDWVYLDLALSDNEKGSRMQKIKPTIRIMAPEDFENGQSIDVKVMRSHDNSTKYKYSWNDGSFASLYSRPISQKGKYWIKIKDEWGNISLASDTLYFGVEAPVTVNSIHSEDIVFTYTNPAKDYITINLLLPFNNSKAHVSLWNMQGIKSLGAEFSVTTGYNNIQLPISEIQRGLYILHMKTNNYTISKKVIVN